MKLWGQSLRRNYAFWGSVLFTMVGFALLARTWIFVARAEPVMATVVDMRVSESSSGGDRGHGIKKVYYPTFQFVDAQGHTQTVVFRYVGSPDYNYRIGQKVAARYLPDRPDQFRVDTFTDTWANGVFIVALGTGMSILAALVGYGIHRAERERQARMEQKRNEREGATPAA